MTLRRMIWLNPQSHLWFVDKSTLSVIIFAKIIYFVIILLSQTVVRILSRQPFFYTVRYSFPLFLIFPGNRKTRRTEVLRVSYVWTQRYLAITNLLYMRQSHDFVVRSRAFVKCPLPRRKKETCKQACSLFFSPWLALYSLLSRILLDDCSNTSWSYSTSTFTISDRCIAVYE